MTLYIYKQHKFKGNAKFKCDCGNRFSRTYTTEWTENPYNKLWVDGNVLALNNQSKKEIIDKLQIAKCPKCDKEVQHYNPITPFTI